MKRLIPRYEMFSTAQSLIPSGIGSTAIRLFEGVNPNRVYLMGYSAGGDSVYQLAPHIADWLAPRDRQGRMRLVEIRKADERGFSVDVHAMRHSFGSLLSHGVKAALRHGRPKRRCAIRRST